MVSTGFSYEALPMRVRFGPGVIAELGAEDDIALIAGQVVASPYANPAPVTRGGVVRLLRAAWAGSPPAVE